MNRDYRPYLEPSNFKNDDSKPFYVVFAGINGTGKSTLFHSSAWHQPHFPQKMERVNPDEIAARSSESLSDIAAGKLAVRQISDLFKQRASFNQETTLSGRSSLLNIMKASELGYRVYLYYLGVQSTDIAIERIAHRVSTGGHNIDSELVRKRLETSLRNLSHAIPYCEEVHIIDNSVDFQTLARWNNGMISWWGRMRTHGLWLMEAMQNERIWKA